MADGSPQLTLGLSAAEVTPTAVVVPRREAPQEHIAAMRSPSPGFESAVVTLYRGLAEYADANRRRYGDQIGNDYVIGEYWHLLGEALRGLLNGETGRLDCGTLDGQIRDLIDSGGTLEAIAEVRSITAPVVPERRAKVKDEPIRLGMAALSDRQRELVALVKVEDNFAVYTRADFIPDWAELKSVMLALGGSWRTKTKKRPGGFAFAGDVDAAEAVRLALETGEVFDAKAADFYETPAELGDELAAFIDPQPGELILEPSAGKGALALAIRRRCPEAVVDCVEALDQHRIHLLSLGFQAVADDFDGFAPSRAYDAVIMNPPFGNRNDARHILRAIGHLRVGGRLAAIASSGVKHRDDRIGREFRSELARHGAELVDNEPGAFKASGTMVNTVSVRMVKK